MDFGEPFPTTVQAKTVMQTRPVANITGIWTGEAAAVNLVMQNWVRYWDAKDVSGIMNLVHVDARMMYGGYQQKIATCEEYPDILPGRMAIIGNLVLTEPDIRISGDNATIRCKQDTPGGDLPVTFLLKKHYSDWKIIRFEYELRSRLSGMPDALSQVMPSGTSIATHVEISKIKADSSGETHFSTEKVKWIYWFNNGRRTPETAVTSLQFYHLRKGLNLGLHPAPRKQFLLILQGTLEIEASSGERRQFSPGSILLVTDIAGTRGHKSTVIG
ncbi:MAG: hypothetical protein GY697_01000, partial [Desulfobacterales bacterium]|nr:hypothetical protein [Desulfobacterales bacterium]